MADKLRQYNESEALASSGKDILSEIADYTRGRIARLKEQTPIEELAAKAGVLPVGDFPFERAIACDDMAFICEIKKASPSKGLIAPHFPYLEIAREYEAGGAAAISCLTEPKYFQGSDKYLEEIAGAVSIPILRKDFVVDEYMIYEAKLLGASAVLLICAMLSDDELARYYQLANSLGLSAIFEVHNEQEIMSALGVGARIIGVNNRNLKTFQMDLGLSVRLRKLVPEDLLFIAESGIKTREDIELLSGSNVNGVLVGEQLMRAQDKAAAINILKGKE